MNSANVIGPSASILCPEPFHEDRIARRERAIVRRRSADADLEAHRRAFWPSSRTPGPTSVCPPRTTGIEARPRRRQGAEPRVDDPIGEQEVGREPVLGRRPGTLVHAEPMGEENARCRRAPRPRAGRGSRRTRRARRGRGAGRGPSGAAGAGVDRSACASRLLARSPALLDERPDATGGVGLEPAEGPGRCPTGDDEQFGPRVGHRPGRPRPIVPRTAGLRGGQLAGPDEFDIERAVQVELEPPLRAQVRHGPARHLRPAIGAAHCRRAGRGSPAGRPARRYRSRRPSSDCSRARAASHPADLPRAASTNAWRSGIVAAGIEPEPSTTSPVFAFAASATSAPERSANGVSSGGPPTIDTSSAPGSPETGDMPLPVELPRVGEQPLERTGGGRERWMKDADDDSGHGPSLATNEESPPPMTCR